ncbi:MAG: TIGR00266 family protein [Candidatus Sericytochromatia bacterium]|nr:TIGR00266 family protein [Candidatus Sericytochromatia bacterium]MEB3221395.1 TIGR00266 family protein [Candidatus Sericytochromatia bacterium]
MRYEIAYQPSYSLAVVHLERGEEIRCESGAMVSMSSDLVLEAKMNGGSENKGLLGSAFGALKRKVLGGESFFVTTVRADQAPGEVTLAPSTPGDIVAMPLDGRALLVQAGSYLASAMTVEVDTKIDLGGGIKNLVGGESLFFLKVSGRGPVFLTSFGAIHEKKLQPGERYTVDSGHLVAYEEGMAMDVGMASEQGGFLKRGLNSVTTGEGLVMKFTGPGTVWLQTRNPEAFSNWVYSLLPKPQGAAAAAPTSPEAAVGGALLGGAGALLGGMFGGDDEG